MNFKIVRNGNVPCKVKLIFEKKKIYPAFFKTKKRVAARWATTLFILQKLSLFVAQFFDFTY